MHSKYIDLLDRLKRFEKVIVAYSGGVDSSLVLKAAVDALGRDNVLAVVASSQLDETDISQETRQQAELIGSKVRIVHINELSDELIKNYSPDSWYHSKMMLYATLNKIKEEENYSAVIDGMIMDDLDDFRPGLLARNHSHVISVLQEANIYKTEVREILKSLDLSIWSKPSSCSLLSRFEYGDTITQKQLDQIRKGEEFLAKSGFEINRVRVHGDLARIEISDNKYEVMFRDKDRIEKFFSKIGFKFVTLDLRPYQSGRMNEYLGQKVINKYKLDQD
ncbi:ATP-dependent sacrificial sulfur transferase LarE [Ignavigranum ruoffiae]|uniref:ATP-dependent sacrificial sulfur transferase LarE n=1 Tax=Ignavigranum ruoffiae TaxID=89093 RepID=UPI0024AE2B4B|nr:ATP-dependent sacrificial sulfur transferase LarE [Ignavigranum ruoffiae]